MVTAELVHASKDEWPFGGQAWVNGGSASASNRTIAVPVGETWLLRSLTCRLGTSPTVANRVVNVQWTVAGVGTPGAFSCNAFNQTASTTVRYSFYWDATEQATHLVGGVGLAVSIPAVYHARLAAGTNIVVQVAGVQVGDFLDAIRLQVSRWRSE